VRFIRAAISSADDPSAVEDRMKKLVLAVAALALAAPAAAQEARAKIGVGVAIDSFAQGGPTVEVYLPIDITPQFRLEPSLGISTTDRPAGQTDSSDVTVGLGAFMLQKVAAPVDVYFGGRLKLNFAHVSPPVGPSDSGTDVILAAAVGGEYYLVPKFSLGLEGQLGYYSNSSAAKAGEGSGFFTTGLAFLRVYF
jgi:hypothetical protein